MKNCIILMLGIVGLLAGCNPKSKQNQELGGEVIGQITSQMTDVMVHDVTNPPLGSRFLHIVVLQDMKLWQNLTPLIIVCTKILNGFPEIEKPAAGVEKSYQLSAALAILETAKKIQPTGKMLSKYEDKLVDSCRTIGISDEVIAASLEYALSVSKQIMKYAKGDKYNLISNYPRYEPKGGNGHWYPTPPGYFPPVEPYFNTVRPFVLDSASQFKPVPPVAFSEDKNSSFTN